MAIEHLRIRPPASFDPTNAKHVDAVVGKVETATIHGSGWSFSSYDADAQELVLQRRSAMTSVAASGSRTDSFDVSLGGRFKPSEGDRAAAELEAQPQFKEAGYRMTEFNVHLDQAKMTRMTDNEYRCREAVATALGAKPWDVQVKENNLGGFFLNLPGNRYVPAKHDKALEDIAEGTVGKFGWYVKTDPRNLTAEIIPAEPPTFEATLPYPFGKIRPKSSSDKDFLDWQFNIPAGEKLAANGSKNEVFYLDLADSAGVLLSGTAGSGKSVHLNQVVFGLKERGWNIAILDAPHKALDFIHAKPFVMEGGFGCQGHPSAVASIAQVYAVKDKVSKLLEQHGVQKWQDLPKNVREENPPHCVIMDETTAQLEFATVPKIRDKSHPMVVEAEQTNFEIELLKGFMRKIPAELRAAGVRIIVASQTSNANTGVPPQLKTNLPNRVLLGKAPTKNERLNSLKDPDGAPEVPINLQSDKRRGAGVGVAQFEGQEACVFKSYFASTDDYTTELLKLGIKKTLNPEPSESLIRKHVPSLADDLADEGATTKGSTKNSKKEGYGHGPRVYEAWEIGPDGTPLEGFERANAAKHHATVVANTPLNS